MLVPRALEQHLWQKVWGEEEDREETGAVGPSVLKLLSVQRCYAEQRQLVTVAAEECSPG